MIFEKRYLFQAHAVAAGANLQGINTCLKDVSSALSLVGGCSTSASGPQAVSFHGQPIISFEEATTSVRGEFIENIPQSICQSTLSRINVLDRIRIESLHSQVTSRAVDNGPELQFPRPGVQEIKGVFIDGAALQVVLEPDDPFLCTPTKHELSERYQHDESFRELCKERLQTREDESLLNRLVHKIPQINGYIVATFVKRLAFEKVTPPGVQIIPPNQLKINDFGQVFFGEIFIGENTRRVTLVRFEFQSAQVPPPRTEQFTLEAKKPPPPPQNPPPPTVSGQAVLCESKPNGETT